ncbi:MAG: hypothetical protein E3J54_05455 [Actinobacteria bacterium]|nr:MAG: hypothetical protein E3J54_05455 [Actinomycetota bacterium]
MARIGLSNLRETLKDPKRRARLILIAGAFLLTVPLFFTLSLTLASNPAFCGSALCHDQQPEYQTWLDSSHANVPCYACHMPAKNAIGFILEKSKTGLLGMYEEFIVGVHRPINKDSLVGLEHIKKDVCERCHNMATRYVSPRPVFSRKMEGKDTKKEKKYHSKHLAKGLNCTVCHNRVVHKEPTEEEATADSRKKEILDVFKEYKGENEETKKKIKHRYKDFLEMKECMRCHSSQKEGNPEWEEMVKVFPEIKEANPPSACETCHDKGWEGLPVGHAKNWRAEHGTIAKKDFGYCMECHDKGKEFSKSEHEKFCINCHSKVQAETFK